LVRSSARAGSVDIGAFGGQPPLTGALSASSLTFSNQVVGTTSVSQTITVTNGGNATLHVTGIVVSGANAADFAETDNNPGAAGVAPGASFTINVTFTPTATGQRTAGVSLADDAGDSPQVVSL